MCEYKNRKCITCGEPQGTTVFMVSTVHQGKLEVTDTHTHIVDRPTSEERREFIEHLNKILEGKEGDGDYV